MRPFWRFSRRAVLAGLGGGLIAADAAMPAGGNPVWAGWIERWKWMEGEVRRRGWTLTPLDIGAPAREMEVGALERRHGLEVPADLREILTRFSGKVRFGWSIPTIDMPFHSAHVPLLGGIRDVVWDLALIDDAILQFNGARKHLANRDDREEPNTPEMWENQFPIAYLINGDFLTIDMTGGGARPIRYFSCELDGLHNRLIARNFSAFVTAYAKLGCAGSSQDEWLSFLGKADDAHEDLDPESAGARRWLAWLARDPNDRQPDDPPRTVPAKSPADYALLKGARSNSLAAVEAALAAGATPDCMDARLPNEDGIYSISFVTALVEAVRHGNVPMIERLLRAGAQIDTRLLSVSEAISSNRPDVVRWLLQHGARANGWMGDRYWPIHVLFTYYRDPPRSVADHLAILTALLDAGADPDARWDHGSTMLMLSHPRSMKVLLDYGADPNARDYRGETPLHVVRNIECARLLIAHGADIEAMTARDSTDREPEWRPPHTPYQARLALKVENYRAILDVLVEAGADPLKRDGDGRSTLWYCRLVDELERHVALGLDPRERMRNGATLLHDFVRYVGEILTRPGARAVLTYLMAKGVDINATMTDGSTALHIAAEIGSKGPIAVLLELGADKTRRDAKGRRPVDLLRRSALEARELLRV